jgi:hypothetical protein
VLTRESNGHKATNVLKNAFAYTGIVGGIAGIATSIVIGCIEAATAFTATTALAATVGTSAAVSGAVAGVAAGASAALAAIPFVGWAVLAVAVVAASIYLLTKVFKGEDVDIDFFAIKGPKDYPLIMPL